MPKITDPRVIQGKINRDNEIFNYFKKRFDKDGVRYEVVETEIILKYGVCSKIIEKIIRTS